MSIKIPYSLLPGTDKSPVLMPMVPITLLNDKYEFSTIALVDSGATGAMISTVITDALKIAWVKIPKKVGATSSGQFIFHPTQLEIEIYGNHFPLTVAIMEGTSPFKCILGEADIFQKAKITFERYKHQFEIAFREFN